MNLILRLIRIIIAAFTRSPLDLLDTSVVKMRVWPNDLDLNLHMNNGRYFTVMDLGRIDLMIRTGVARWMWRQRWTPVVGSETIRFKRSLKPFQPYLLKTRVLCWDERWVFLEQRFETLGGELVALGIVKAVLTAQRRTMRPKEALKIIGMLRRSPAMPPAVKAWALAEEWMAEPRSAAVPPELEEALEPVQPGLAAVTPAGADAPATEPRASRFTAWRRKAAPAAAPAALEPLPASPAPEPAIEPPASPPEPMVPADAPEPPPGRFGQWRRRRAS
jgi:acyl-CoA thioesterase FadM